MTRIVAWVAAFGLAMGAVSAENSATFSEDFENGIAAWEMTDAKAWQVSDEEGNKVLALTAPSEYKPPHRSPLNIALVKDLQFESFEMTVRVKQTGREYGHRDMCLFLGYQDPANFYYVHLASKADENANSIFIVNDAPRVSIAETRTNGTTWDDQYHTVKIRRDAESGTIEVFFDDMDKPVMTATDKNFTKGRIGVGSFDDVGHFDDIRVTALDKK